MLFKVPGGTSSDGLPGTVTLPGFMGWRNCRWLPFWVTCTHPSVVNRRMTSRTFRGTIDHPGPGALEYLTPPRRGQADRGLSGRKPHCWKCGRIGLYWRL